MSDQWRKIRQLSPSELEQVDPLAVQAIVSVYGSRIYPHMPIMAELGMKLFESGGLGQLESMDKDELHRRWKQALREAFGEVDADHVVDGFLVRTNENNRQ